MVAAVSGGLAEPLDVDVVLVRMGIIVALGLSRGIAVSLYLATVVALALLSAPWHAGPWGAGHH